MKVMKLAFTALAIVILVGGPVFAQQQGYKYTKTSADGKTTDVGGPNMPIFSGAAVGAGLGAALTIIGAGYGFGRIGSAALESMARQPEVAGKIQTAMLIIAALLEGATFFSLIVCIQVAGTGNW